mgnify:CR=1 FL=1
MDNTTNNDNDKSLYSEPVIDFVELSSILWKKKISIILLTSIFAISSIFYSLSLPNIYKSTAVLAPTSNTDGNLSSIANQYSNIASIAGIQLPSSAEADKVSMGLEIMKSFSFFETFVNKYDLLFKLQALKGWDQNNNKLIVDPKVFEESKNKWVSRHEFSINGVPTMQKAHRDFLKTFTLQVDNKTGFVTMTISHYSPFVAKELLDLLILEINEISKTEDIKIAEDSIKFLNEAATNTQLNDIRQGVNNVIIKQIETITFANSSPQYLLKNLSPPIAPEVKSSPRRSIIVIMITVFGAVISCLYVIFSHYNPLFWRKKRQ